jgi:FdhD protein
VDTRPLLVTMRTPGHDEELAAGLLFTEGLIRKRRDILRIAPSARNDFGNVLNVFLGSGIKVNFAQMTRHVYAASSCGLCGKSYIAAVRRHFQRITSRVVVRAETLLGLGEKLRQAQETFARTGGLHAAAIFNARGRLLVLREDIGRHNAVDKVLGYGLLNRRKPFDRHILLVSGRASFEIIQKALAGRIPVVAAVSAPSSLAVRFAAANGQTLVGFLRGTKMNLYSHRERIEFD